MKITKRQLRRIIREEYSRLKTQGLIKEGKAEEWDAKIKRNKPYIMGDASLFYWLRQNGNPLSIEHYSMSPVSMPEVILELISENAFLQGTKCIGRIASYMSGYAIYLFADRNEYKVVCREHTTGALIVAEIPRDEELLVEITRYMTKMSSGNAELDSYITLH